MKDCKNIDGFWKNFLKSKNSKLNLLTPNHFCFGNNEEMANELVELVLSGKKCATSSSFPAYALYKEELPKEKEYSIITNHAGEPKCIIQNTKVSVVPFDEITCEMALKEGEAETLESWQNEHRDFFINDGKSLGYEFNEKMLVVFEEFDIIYK